MDSIENFDPKGYINWIAKIAKQGDARIITVPKKYWENKIVNEEKLYRVYLVEIPENDDSK